MDFPDSSAGKESACNAGDLGSIPGLRRAPGGGHGNPLQYSCLENPHGQRTLAGYSPWGCKELDTTEQLGKAQAGHISIGPSASAAVLPMNIHSSMCYLTTSLHLSLLNSKALPSQLSGTAGLSFDFISLYHRDATAGGQFGCLPSLRNYCLILPLSDV